MSDNNCVKCGKPFGNHAADCAVKFRDTLNPDPEVQKSHQGMDQYYDRAILEDITPFDGLSVKLPETP